MLRDELVELLKKNFPYGEFIHSQEKILNLVTNQKNVLGLMPTGAGKSLCYQFPAKLTQNLVLVISPLIALMQDQTQKAKDLGIRATFVNSSLSAEEKQKRYERIANNEYQLIFVTPERFRKTEFVQALDKIKVELLVVDEAHCISQWGHDFRPDYSQIAEFAKLIKNPPILALTATATAETQKDIVEKLQIKDNFELVWAGMERENLQVQMLEAYENEDKLELLLKFLNPKEGSQIVYFLLIDTLHKVSTELQKRKIPHRVYHGDLKNDQRKQNLSYFQKHENVLMLATPAFGLGIDKPNIRQVFHMQMPGSIESYFQEIGRAGRDGKPSQAFLLYSENDLPISMEFIKWAHPEKEYLQSVFALLSTYTTQFFQEGFDFLREKLSFKNKRDFRVEAAYHILARWGCVQPLSILGELEPKDLILRAPDEQDFKNENQKVLFQYQNRKLLEMYQLAQNQDQCRMGIIYKYFGGKYTECGHCDVCLK
jgi:ATP-dependent DNA helicase RecQ